MTDLIERLRAHPDKAVVRHWEDWAQEADTLMREAAAALEAKASEGERRGLERAAEVAESRTPTHTARQTTAYAGGNDRMGEIHHARHVEAWEIGQAIRALIPEAPAQPELASAAANQLSTTEVGLPEAPAREGELEAAAKAIFEQKGLHLSTGKAWERAIRSDRYYCLQYAEAALIAIGRLPPPPSQNREG